MAAPYAESESSPITSAIAKRRAARALRDSSRSGDLRSALTPTRPGRCQPAGPQGPTIQPPRQHGPALIGPDDYGREIDHDARASRALVDP
jgi:hypothetical protein